MLASLESVQFVTNILFGKFMLKAHISNKMYFGTVLTVAGTIVAVIFSSSTPKTPDLDDLVDNWFAPVFVTYLIIMGCSIGGINVWYKAIEVAENKGKPMPYSHIVKPLLYATWSALFGTLSVVNAKVLAELLRIQAGGHNIFTELFFYLTLIMWFITVGIWLYRLNDALSKFDPLFIIPLLQCNFILFAIISGGIFFKEFESFSAGQWAGFCSGVIVMFTGLGFLTPSPEETEEGDDESDHSDNEKENTPTRRMSRRKSHMGGAPLFDEKEVENDLPSFRQPAPSLMGVGNMGEEWFGRNSVIIPKHFKGVHDGVGVGIGVVREGLETSVNAVTGVVATGLVTGAIAAEEIIKGIGDIPEKLGDTQGEEKDTLQDLNSTSSDTKVEKVVRAKSSSMNSKPFSSL